jgi:YHS domain-containing protein
MKIKSIILSLIIFLGFNLKAQNLNLKHYNIKGNLAVEGYDVVSYFSSKATKGNSKFSATSSGVVYYFSSQTNKDLFLKNADYYKPQYGGWCAYAMGNSGEKVTIDPETFKILNGKLYLFYNSFFNNTLNSWNKNESNLKLKADANWKKIFK